MSTWWSVDDPDHGTYLVSADTEQDAVAAVEAAVTAADTFGFGWRLCSQPDVQRIESAPAGHPVLPGPSRTLTVLV